MNFILGSGNCGDYTRKWSTLFLVLVIFHSTLFSQSKKPIFQSLQQGLSNQSIQCILKDSEGYMWFGTKDGLNKFDGTNFEIYENSPKDTSSLSHNSINSIVEDKDHRIWIGTSDGLNLYNRNGNNFIHIRFPGIERLYISSLCAESNGNLWIGTFGVGAILFNYKDSFFRYYAHSDSDQNTIISNFVTCLTIDKRRNVWIGTRNGLSLLNQKSNIFRQFTHTLNPGNLSSNLISALHLDTHENLWIGTLGGGLNKLSLNKQDSVFHIYQHSASYQSLSNDIVMQICEDKSGNFWIGTENGGLNCLDSKTGKFRSFQTEEGNTRMISSNSITSLYFSDQILWIGTYNQGICYVDEKFEKFELFQRNSFLKNSIPDNDVTGFAEDLAGSTWIATDGGGICQFDMSTKTVKKIVNREQDGQLSNNNVQAIIYDKNENIWVGTWAGGIDRLNKGGRKIRNYKVEGFIKTGNNKIITLYEDKEKNIWAGTAGSGLFLYNPTVDKFIQITDHNRNTNSSDIEYVTSIIDDFNKNIWVGTLYGLVKLESIGINTFKFSKYYSKPNSNTISSNRITVVFEDSKKNLWFGTEDQGLNCFNPKHNSFTYFQKQDGLLSNSIRGILEDRKENLWISTSKGISRFDSKSHTFKSYTKDDGLNSEEFYRNSCLTSRSGEFLFGGNYGFNAFRPDSIKMNAIVPPVYFTDFKIFNKSVPVGGQNSPLFNHISQTKKIVLSYKQNSFTIEFVALNYTRSSQNQYKYILEGLEKEWNSTEHKHAATYTNINPGTYVFKVMGSNNDGIWNLTPTILEIKVLPPFWRTIWAYLFYFLSFSGLFFVFIRLTVIRAKQSQVLELNQMKLNFFTNISHELRTPLTLILSPLENLVSSSKVDGELKSQLQLVYRNAGRLFRLVNELMDFSKTEESKLKILVQPGDIVKFSREVYEFYSDEAQRRQINYQFISKESAYEVWFDRDKLEKVILNLLSNAFKFTSDGGKIIVNIERSKRAGAEEFIMISVIDNGTGISQKYIDKVFDRFFQSPDDLGISQRGTGIGLALAKNLIELHHGTIEVTSEKSKETCFSVHLPLGNACFNKDEILTSPINIAETTISVSANEPAQVAPKNAPVILLVEDNFDLRKYIVSQLSAGYKLLEAENGEDGYNKAVREIPDLIISDIMMPRMTGIEFCKKVKEEITTSHIPVILLTAKIALDEKIEGIQTGADAYITKPFNIRFLEVSIKNLINTRHKLFQRFSQEVFIMPKEFSNTPLDQDFLERAIEFIEKNISKENLTVEELASQLSLSHSQTYRKIKALTGQSATEFIRTIRLKMAIKLMETGKISISEISFKVGFASPAYFTKCFREQFGKPPSEYLSDFKNKKKTD